MRKRVTSPGDFHWCWYPNKERSASLRWQSLEDEMRVLLIVGLVFLAALLAGCDESGDRLTLNRICRNLQTVTTTNEMRMWLHREIVSRSRDAQILPSKVEITELPQWAKSIFGNSPPRATLLLEKNEAQDHIDLVWAHGRGIAGVSIGNVGFKPSLGSDYLVVKCADGVFAYSPRRFP